MASSAIQPCLIGGGWVKTAVSTPRPTFYRQHPATPARPFCPAASIRYNIPRIIRQHKATRLPPNKKGTHVVNRTNDEWLTQLATPGPQRDAALADLRVILLRGLKRGLLRRVNTGVPEFDAQADDFAQNALLKVLDNLDSFAGRAKFTTWAHKIAVSVALTELRRKRWQDTSLDGIMDTEDGVYTPSFVADPAPAPANVAERADMLRRIQTLINDGLTEKQRTAVNASIIQGLSTRQVAAEMDMTPNALYKLIHDARLRLKKAMADEGLTPADVLAIFN